MLNTVPEILLQSNKAFSSSASRDNYCTSPRERERETAEKWKGEKEKTGSMENEGGRQRATHHNKLLIIISTLLTCSSA